MLDGVERSRLKMWADQAEARFELPRLIRRLILETTPGLVGISMPASEGTALPEWDGTVRSTGATPWVPAGLSLWEISVNKNAEQKATDDYDKRLETPDGSSTNSAVYVAVSLRDWVKRDTWAKERIAQERWSEVRAYGLDDVHAWLENAPVTSAWLAEQLELDPHGFRSAEQWWDEWASKTNPRLTPELVLAGRHEQARQLIERFNETPRITTVRGASVDEVSAFIISAVSSVDGLRDEQQQLLARIALIDESRSWRKLLARQTPLPLVLIPMRDELARKCSNNPRHHIVVPMTKGETDIVLPRLDASGVSAVLCEASMDEKQARENGYLARRSLTALRVRLARNPELFTPTWACEPVSQAIKGILLAGSWSDERQGDQAVLSELTGLGYDQRRLLARQRRDQTVLCELTGLGDAQLRKRLNELSREGYPLVVNSNDSWHLTSIDDSWLFLWEYLTKDDLCRLYEVSVQVLGTRDPSLDLHPRDRWLSSVKGKNTIVADLRRGLARSLVLLSLYGDKIKAPNRSDGTRWAAHIVHNLLSETADHSVADTWASLADVLPLLAEAAPDVFIQALQRNLEDNSTALTAVFTDGTHSVMMFNADLVHTGLLWALERLAWSSEYFGAVVKILADLHRIDPGGRLSNRPLNTLKSLFCSWRPHTSASRIERMATLDGLRQTHTSVAWELMVELIPKYSTETVTPTNEPEYRDWKTETLVSAHDHEFSHDLISRIVEDASGESDRLIQLINQMLRFSEGSREQIINELRSQVSRGSLSSEDQLMLYKEIRRVAHICLASNQASRVRSIERAGHLLDVASLIEPDDAVDANEWLFNEWRPGLVGFAPTDQGYDDELARQRGEALVKIYGEADLSGVIRLAEQVQNQRSPGYRPIGVALADGLRDQVQPELLDMMDEDSSQLKQGIAYYYYSRRFQQAGWDWLESLIGRSDLSDSKKGFLLVSTRDFPRSWERAAELGADTKTRYWQIFDPGGLGQEFAYTELVIEALLKTEQIDKVLELFSIYGVQSSEIAWLAIRALEKISSSSSKDEAGYVMHDLLINKFQLQMYQYQLQKIFQDLAEYQDSVGMERLALLEWEFLPFLRSDLPVATLRQLMFKDSAFFVQLVTIAFPPEHRTDETVEEFNGTRDTQNAHRTRAAYRLLLPRMPAQVEFEGLELELSSLKRWVDETRRLLSTVDRVTAGEQCIGQMLGSLPAESGGVKPALMVRDLLETIRCQNIELGVYLVICNSRGATCRSPDEGGDQERELAAKYSHEAEQVSSQWPRTAAILREISESYEAEGRRQDEEAEHFRSGLA